MSELDAVEICAGAGGQSLGLHLAGFRHRLAVELDPTAAETLSLNLGRLARAAGHDEPTIAVGDVADAGLWDPSQYEGVSLLAGGVPCPPFSLAGKQLGSSDERDLFAWAVELAGRLTPQAVMLENVRGLSMPRFAGYRQAVLDRFADFGYNAEWRLLHARDFGVPQLRPRFVLVALREEYAPFFSWPEPLRETPTVGMALHDLMAANGWPGATKWAEHANTVAPTIVGGSKKHGGADLGPTRAKQAWAQLGVDGHGIADAAPGPDVPPAFVPKLTTEMVARLQGWWGREYEWEFIGRKTSRYRQIGNAFPPPFARAVGETIASALKKSSKIQSPREVNAAHDLVYRILRDQGTFLTESDIVEISDDKLQVSQVQRRLEYLQRDFFIECQLKDGKASYRLGEWKAFRGQENHARHLAFTELKSRNRVS